MIADWKTRNDSNRIVDGLNRRFRWAKFFFFIGARWDAYQIPMKVWR